jgi:hypothetical protein
MALTLAAGISASDRYCTVNQPPTQPPGSYYRIGDEVVQHIGYVTTTPIWTPNFTQLYIARAQLGTSAASHLSGVALTYVRAEFLSATAETDPGPFETGGVGGGSGVTVDNTVDPPTPVATLVAPGAEIVGDEARLFSSTATGTGVTASVSMTATAEGGDAEAKRTATTDLGAANVTSFATVTDAGGGVAEANNVATSQAHNATANLSANVVAGFGSAQASNAAASFNGNADATSSAYAAGDGNALTSNFAGVGGTGTATADVTAFGGAGTAWVKAEADATSARLGFFSTAPVARPAAIADATDAASTQARLNDLLAALRALGLIAS